MRNQTTVRALNLTVSRTIGLLTASGQKSDSLRAAALPTRSLDLITEIPEH
jgi:hypothetical protein